jgi:hypothetical protein
VAVGFGFFLAFFSNAAFDSATCPSCNPYSGADSVIGHVSSFLSLIEAKFIPLIQTLNSKYALTSDADINGAINLFLFFLIVFVLFYFLAKLISKLF